MRVESGDLLAGLAARSASLPTSRCSLPQAARADGAGARQSGGKGGAAGNDGIHGHIRFYGLVTGGFTIDP